MCEILVFTCDTVTPLRLAWLDCGCDLVLSLNAVQYSTVSPFDALHSMPSSSPLWSTAHAFPFSHPTHPTHRQPQALTLRLLQDAHSHVSGPAHTHTHTVSPDAPFLLHTTPIGRLPQVTWIAVPLLLSGERTSTEDPSGVRFFLEI
jgi:hypothetical protein